MKYESTRGGIAPARSACAIWKGAAEDGGLYVPSDIESFDWKTHVDCDYRSLAKAVIGYFLTDYSSEELDECINTAYTAERFGSNEIAPISELDGNTFMLELWHGPTAAFKDLALQLLPHLVSKAKVKMGDDKKLAILVATSGDTGSSAMSGFSGVPGIQVLVFYPEKGVSAIQRLQMVTQQQDNLEAVAVRDGNFDAAQSGVKSIMVDPAFRRASQMKGIQLSTANSVNWGRIVAQIAYYWSSYMSLLRAGKIASGEKINVVVPTGNFGNILAAYYAQRMGMPIGKLVCASNENDVIARFLQTGSYDSNRELLRSISPSMDILVSSNLERLIFELGEHDPAPVRSRMTSLALSGKYAIDAALKKRIDDIFWGARCSEAETLQGISECYNKYGRLIDPHTAVAYQVYRKFQAQFPDSGKAILVSTASPFKFNHSVAKAILGEAQIEGLNEFRLLDLFENKLGIEVPQSFKRLETMPVLHTRHCYPSQIRDVTLSILEL